MFSKLKSIQRFIIAREVILNQVKFEGDQWAHFACQCYIFYHWHLPQLATCGSRSMRCPKIVTAEAISSPKGPGHWYVKGTGTGAVFRSSIAALGTGFGDQFAEIGSWCRFGEPVVGVGKGGVGVRWGRSLTAGFSDYIRRAVVPYLHNDSNWIHIRQVTPDEFADWMKYKSGVHASLVRARTAPSAILVFVTGEWCVHINRRGRYQFLICGIQSLIKRGLL